MKSSARAVAAALLLASPVPSAGAQEVARQAAARDVLEELVAVHGASGHEAAVRAAVRELLPEDVAAAEDTAGNLLVRVGRGAPLVVFVAHLDEVGFEVAAIEGDGRLRLDRLGGFSPALFEARPALAHGARGTVPVVIPPRQSPGETPGREPDTLFADPGTSSRAATEALGLAVGHAVTIPKDLLPLAGSRVSARSLDDRAGSAALVLALRELDRSRLRHAVLFLWSVREETGLHGARAAAADLAGEDVARVHAVDTFVSSDAPLESRAFAYARLGAGAVARAVDHSNVAPPALVDSLVALAERRGIPLQVGATGGGNDGSVFVPYGVPDLPIAWPLRYSHSPVETADLRDVLDLADLVRAIAEEW